jgi:D-inositol-3-phosphate glycosyltransferase
MRIAVISEHASPLATLGEVDAGGQNTHVAALSAALGAAGHEIRVYTRRDSPDPPAVVRLGERVEVVHVPAGPPVALPKDDLLPYMGAFGEWMAADWCGGWRPDVAHAHFWMSGLATVTAAQSCRMPVVQTFHALGSVKRRHQGAADTSSAQRIGYERALGGAVDRIIAQCRDEIGELVRLGVPRDRMALVPSGVDVRRFRPAGPAVPRRPGHARILTVARLVERKGIEDLIRALPRVPRAELIVVGGPPAGRMAADGYAGRLREVAGHCRVADRVRLVGGVPAAHMPAWYRSADLVAATPWYEPFGLTALEAMACGVPVVASAVGGLMDSVVDGVTGELVAPSDPAGLARTLRGLLADETRRMSYAAAAVDRAVHCYTWPRIADRLTDVYTAVSAATPRASVEAGV